MRLLDLFAGAGGAAMGFVWGDLAYPNETAFDAAARMVRDMFDGAREIGSFSREFFSLKDGRKVYRIEFNPRAADGRGVWTVYETHKTEVPR